MKKRILVLLASLALIGGSSLFATTGIGAQGGYGVGGDSGAALTFKVSNVPCVFAADAFFGNSGMAFGLTADWWIANPKIVDSFGFFYGVGASGSVVIGNSGYTDLRVGGRVVGGLNVFILKGALEFYAEAAWNPYFEIALAGDSSYAGPHIAYFPINAGFRFWF